MHAEICRHCQRVGVGCNRSSVRFREGLALPSIAFPEEPSWPRINGKGTLYSWNISRNINNCNAHSPTVRFHDETSEITSLYVEISEDPESQWAHERDDYSHGNPHHETVIDTPKEPQIGLQHVVNLRSPSVPNTAAENPSPASLSIISSSSSRTRSSYTTLHTFTEREAILIRNFVENMALWVRSPIELLCQKNIEADRQ